MKFRGYWMAGEKSRRTMLVFCWLTLDEKYVRILDTFEKAERRRHDYMYDGRFSMDKDEAQEMVRKARTLLGRLALLE